MGVRELDHIRSQVNGEYSDSGAYLAYDASTVCISHITARFGHPRPFSIDAGYTGNDATLPPGVDAETYRNPYPRHFVFLADNSGSHVLAHLDRTIDSMRSYYTEQWDSAEVAKRFSVINCRGTPIESPIGFEQFTGVTETWTFPLYRYQLAMFPGSMDDFS